MTSLRLLADDLTGALDAAAEFVPLTGPVQTFWHGSIPAELPANAALDSGTRELSSAVAAGIVRDLSHHLRGGTIAFKKIDSLLRGPTMAEVAACAADWRYAVLAPAFPYQDRITRDGRQYARHAGAGWVAAEGDLLSLPSVRHGRIDADLRPGITVFDAATDDDLLRIVATARRCPHPVLWIGTGGLAQALAAGPTLPAMEPLPWPMLGLFGSDQPATAAQLAACGAHWTVLSDAGDDDAERIAAGLVGAGVVLASFAVPANSPRAAAACHIGGQIDRLTQVLPPPGSLIVAGGETLRRLCRSLGATSLEVRGRIVPGVPRSVMRGGRWNGVTVVSKSGAFGHPRLLRDLLPATAKRNPP